MEESTGGTHSTTLAARPNVSADTVFTPDWDVNSVSRPDDRDLDSEDEQEDERRITHPAVAGGVKKSKRKGPGLNVPLEEFIKNNPEVVGDDPAPPRQPRAKGKHKQSHPWVTMPWCCFCKVHGHALHNCSKLKAKKKR